MAMELLVQQTSRCSITIAEEGILLQEYAEYISTHPKPPVHICLIGGNVNAYKIS